MKEPKDTGLFAKIRAFITEYLPGVRNCSRHTVRSYRAALDQFVTYVAKMRKAPLITVTFGDFSAENVTAFLASLESDRGRSIVTRNHRLACLRAFVAYAAGADLSLVSVRQAVDSVPMKNLETGGVVKFMSEKAVSTLLATPDTKTAKGRRDRALLTFMYDSGARVQEAVGITLADLELRDNPSATLHGKGRKSRSVPLMVNTVRILAEYMKEFHPRGNEESDLSVFYVLRNDARKRMTEDNVRKLVRHYGDIARHAEPEVLENLHPHVLRHSRAMHLYQNGMPLEMLSQWLGHAQLETTLIYAHAGTEMKRKAIAEATPADSPLGKHVNPTLMKVEDDDLVRRLYGLL